MSFKFFPALGTALIAALFLVPATVAAQEVTQSPQVVLGGVPFTVEITGPQDLSAAPLPWSAFRWTGWRGPRCEASSATAGEWWSIPLAESSAVP